MERVLRVALGGFLSLAVVACSAATLTASRQPDQAGAVCTESKDRAREPAGAVAVAMENDPVLPPFAAAWVYAPSAITARVGQAIVFTNRDPDTQHSAELKSGACGTDYLDPNASDSLVFKVPGSYPFYCLVHGTAMTGTITISR